jgi:uncharacterized membrane protein
MLLAVTLPSWLDADRLKTIAVLIVGALLAFSIVSAWLIKKVVVKVISLGLMLGLALAFWTQRSNLADCASSVKDNPTEGASASSSG